MANYYQNKLTVLHDSAERIEEVFAAIRTEDRDVIDCNAVIPRPERLNIDHWGTKWNSINGYSEMHHDEISRFFSEEEVKKAFQLHGWPAGTEIVCYCRSTDSHDTIEQIAQRGGWKIVEYVHIDELPIAKLYKSGHVMFAKREALEWKRDPTMPTYEEWRNQMLGGLRPSDWDKFIVR